MFQGILIKVTVSHLGDLRSSFCHEKSPTPQFILLIVDQLCFLKYKYHYIILWLDFFRWFPIILKINIKSFSYITSSPCSGSWLHFQSYRGRDLQRNIWNLHGLLFFITKFVEEGQYYHLLDRNRGVWNPLLHRKYHFKKSLVALTFLTRYHIDEKLVLIIWAKDPNHFYIWKKFILDMLLRSANFFR